MAPKRLSKGGAGNRDAVNWVAEQRIAGESITNIRAKLTTDGYSKGRISQLCPYNTLQHDDAAAPSNQEVLDADASLENGILDETSTPDGETSYLASCHSSVEELCVFKPERKGILYTFVIRNIDIATCVCQYY